MDEKSHITAALAGNPNCGKTTIFNALTGANQHVGNYSGVTVEKRDGIFKHAGMEVTVIDLPGTYSLNYHSPEEKVAQEELLSGKIDLLIAIVDSGSLSRSLVFVAQLMQLDLPMILCLNMWDEAEKAGLQLDIEAMGGLLGMPVIQTVGSHNKGIDRLKDEIIHFNRIKPSASHLRLGAHAADAIKEIKSVLPASHQLYPDWTAAKLLADDPKFTEEVGREDGGKKAILAAKNQREHIQSDTKQDIKEYMTEQYYGFADGLLKEVTVKRQRANAREISDNIDKWLAHPVFGLIFFLVIVYVLFQLTFTLGQIPMDWIDAGFGALSDAISGSAWAGDHPDIASLIVDGMIGGVGGVIVFLPNIVILFMGLCFLEDTGYMARTAFLLDKLMHKIGLHGRSFIPLITGFGCSVPGMMATRTIAGEKERLTTMFIVPFMSCGARVPIWLLLVPIFFAQEYQGIAMMGIYILGAAIGLLVAYILRKTVYKGQEEPFVMELPPYRLPTLRAILMHMWERSWLYLKKAGTIILAISIIFWALAAYPKMTEQEEASIGADTTIEEVQLENSYIGQIGHAIEPIFKPLGFDWKISTAVLGALSAKEVFVSQMGIVYSLGDEVDAEAEDDEDAGTLREKIRTQYSTLTGICLIIFMLLTSPCFASLAVAKRESNSWKFALGQFFGMFGIAWILAALVHAIGSLLV